MQSHLQHRNVLFVVAVSEQGWQWSTALKYTFIKCTTLGKKKKRHSDWRQRRGERLRFDMWRCFVEIAQIPLYQHCKDMFFLWTQTLIYTHLKHNTNTQKAHRFPFWPDFLVAPEWNHNKASSWSERLSHRSHWGRHSCLPVFWVCGYLEDTGAASSGLTARQSMVKVDVAQVLWRSFWQTHFVVVVDHPPAGGRSAH